MGDTVLTDMGLVERIERAASLEQLRKVTFDPDAIEVALAIRAALHPTSGRRTIASKVFARAL